MLTLGCQWWSVVFSKVIVPALPAREMAFMKSGLCGCCTRAPAAHAPLEAPTCSSLVHTAPIFMMMSRGTPKAVHAYSPSANWLHQLLSLCLAQVAL
jgi:hypothetical protein